MREAKRKVARRVPARARKPAEESASAQHAAELMALAVEAAQSRHLPDFLQRFAERSKHMLEAAWCGVAVFRGRETEIHLAGGVEGSEFPKGTNWLIAKARAPRNAIDIQRMDAPPTQSFGVRCQASSVVFVAIGRVQG